MQNSKYEKKKAKSFINTISNYNLDIKSKIKVDKGINICEDRKVIISTYKDRPFDIDKEINNDVNIDK